MYIYKKNDTEKYRPVIVWIHGEGFRSGNDKTQSYIVVLTSEFATKGYVSVSINYRLSTGTNWIDILKNAIDDAMLSLDFIRNNSEKFGIEKNKIIIAGGSAGGMIGTNLCYLDSTKTKKWDKSGIIGLVNLWGSPNSYMLLGVIDKNDPPTLIIHGTKDNTVPFTNSEKIAQELKSNGVKFVLYPGLKVKNIPQ